MPTDAHHHVILDSLNEAVFTVDLDWRVTTFNRAAEQITGIDREDAIGRPCWEVFRASVCESSCPLKRTFSTNRPTENARAYIVTPAGKRVPIRISAAILRDEDGEVIGGVETFQDLSRIEELEKELRARYTFEDIVGRSPAMVNLFEILPQIAASDSTVLIEGASGTGKELFARAIHNLSPRKRKRFVAVNCGALPDTLFESELFGYKAGAFTDARRDKPGRFALAEGGTIFLDEIGDISPAMQSRLLRVLQERTYEPLGGVDSVKADVRVVAATNRNLAERTAEGKFREDLFYRIRVVRINLPPLRERREDIPLLAEHFVDKYARLTGKSIEGVTDAVMARFVEYQWPGNVRELENIIEQAFVMCNGSLIDLHHLPPELRPSDLERSAHLTPRTSLESMERLMIEEALRRNNGNRRRSAADLGIDPSTLYRKMKSLGIEPPPTDGRQRV
ncbi:MAG TPA: PAS domain-containing protein [Firmicutes bacterium]|nr:PAS domain-containing protein [Bacillota bacterium]